MSQRSLTVTQVGIVGGGPAGLMLSHLLAQAGIDSVVIDNRTRREIEETVRAGILERDSVRLLIESGVSDRVLTEGHKHAGIDLRFSGLSHRIDFQALIGESVWLYPQTDVFIDLADARERDRADVRFGISGTQVFDLTSDQPGIVFTDATGAGRRSDVTISSARTGPAASAGWRFPKASAVTISASTPSPGWEFSPKPRPVPRNSSTPTPTGDSR